MRFAGWTCLGAIVLALGCDGRQRRAAPDAGRLVVSARAVCHRPILEVLQEAAERELTTLGIAAAVRRDPSDDWILEIEYRLREYQVHSWQKDGRWSVEASPARGPDVGGFRFELILQTGMYGGQLGRSDCSTENPGLGELVRCLGAYHDAYVSKIDMPPINRNIQVNIECGIGCDRQSVERVHRALLRACKECGWLATHE